VRSECSCCLSNGFDGGDDGDEKEPEGTTLTWLIFLLSCLSLYHKTNNYSATSTGSNMQTNVVTVIVTFAGFVKQPMMHVTGSSNKSHISPATLGCGH
jgi:hypothetical protein